MATKIKKRSGAYPFAAPPKTLEALRLVYAGAQHLDNGDAKSAENSWRRAADIDPKCAAAWTYLTDLLAVSERPVEALACLDKLVAASGRTAANLYIWADKSSFLKNYDQARRFLDEALALDPKLEAEANGLRAAMDFNDGDWVTALRRAERILEAAPLNYEARHIQLACLHSLGWLEEEVAACRAAIGLQPDSKVHNRLLFKLNYLSSTTPELLFEESKRWNDLYAAPLAREIAPHTNTPDPHRRLKIGYFSPDFRNHAIMKLLPGVFENHDHEQFEIFAYAINTKHDAFTDFVEQHVDHFADLPADREIIAARVRADGIDILVDLAGHTMAPEGYLTFAMKPAPIQVTWLGALATTGLATMDYFIGDAYMPYPGTEHLFTEKVYRLKTASGCYRPAADLPVMPSPWFKNGFITFGCFNEPRKITRDVIKVWSVILHFHPTSKLILKYESLSRDIAQQRIRQWFSEDGISGDRLFFEDRSRSTEYMETWNRIDIALDPFPYNGGTTTLDALWMGVPVVTVPGRLAVACIGAAILAHAGLPTANTFEQYVALANVFVNTIPVKPDLRQNIRESFLKSMLMDEPALAQAIEGAYRDVWQTWCASRPLLMAGEAPVCH